MFLHRLKNEFAENLKLVLALWITLGITAWSFFQWWFGAPGDQGESQQIIGGFAVFGAGVAAFFLTTTLFKRDDLKHPQEFWATRPIRSFTLFGAKLVFAWLVIALPCGVLMTVLGLIAGVGSNAVWNGLEIMMWMGLATNLLALSCMAHPGNRALFGFFSFIGGVIIVSIAISNEPLRGLLRPHEVSGQQVGWNLLIVLLALNVWFGFRCWRLIRDKHAGQNPLVLAALGFLLVPLIAFVPLPGHLPRFGLGAPSVSLPTVTDAESGYSGVSLGDRYGANFAAMQIGLIPAEPLSGENWEVVDSRLRVEGEDDSLHEVVCSGIITSQGGPHASSKGKPEITYYVYDRRPASGGSSSSGGGSKAAEIIATLPRRKVRITGTINLNRIGYREIASGPLDRPFSHREGGVQCSFDPSAARSLRQEASASWKTYAPPLVTSHSGHRWEAVGWRIEDPANPNFSWINQLGGNSSGGGAFFGSYRINWLRVTDAEIESDYHWRESKERGYAKSVQEWKKEARLVCEVVNRVTPFLLPVDVEVEVPDPGKLRELLSKGGLR